MLNIRSFLRGLRIIPSSGNNTTLAGELQVNSSDSNNLYYNDGVSASPISTASSTSVLTNKSLDDSTTAIVNTSDNTKKITFSAGGGTTGTKTTLASSQSVNRTQTLQDVTDTFVYRASTDTLTNKSISGSTNTLTNLPASALTGQVSVANGGTGLATLTANNVILGNGSSSPTFVAPSTSGNVLTSNGTTWQSTAFSALTNPMTTTGDIIIGNTGSTPARLGVGTSTQILGVSGGLPAWTEQLTADNSTAQISSGVISVKNQGITATQIANNTITRAQEAAVGQGVSSSSGNFSNSSGSYVDVTNLSVTITTTGRPVMIMFQAASQGYIGAAATSPNNELEFLYKILRDSTNICEGLIEFSSSSASSPIINIPPGGMNCLDVGASASSHTYKLQILAAEGLVSIHNIVMSVYEL